MLSDELVLTISAAILADAKIAPEVWDELVLVARISGAERQINGFLYEVASQPSVGVSLEGPRPRTPKSFEIGALISQLRDTMFVEGKSQSPWHACVFRIERITGDVRVHFEYEDSRKWKVTPATMHQVAGLALSVTG